MTEYRTPGQLIKSLLVEKEWSQRTLAIVIGKGETTINKIIAGKQPVDAETAILLEEVFGVPADTFLALQRSYDLAMAQVSSRPDPARSTRAHLFGGLPIAEMIRRGWLEANDPRNIVEVEGALAKFFGVASPAEIEILPHAAKKTMVNTEPTAPQLAWLYRVKSMAEEMIVPRYSQSALRAALGTLKLLTTAPEEARRVSRILADCGVRFVLVESLPSAKIDGVCFWLNDNAPVVGLSLRHDRIDNFWFVLRHELEHVLQGHGRHAMVLDTELEGDRAGTGPDVPEEERLANAAAQEFCVPSAKMEAFVARKAPFFSERDLIGFARSLGVHPGIVAGQLQHRTGRYERFRQHLAKIRSYATSGAMTDGWGNIAPVGL